MKIDFRQGVIRPYYSQLTPGDTSIPTYLRKNGNSVFIRATVKDPIIANFCHYDKNYLYEETEDKEAWKNIIGNPPFWLYWDLNEDGIVSYGYTKVAPRCGITLPTNPVSDQHFFSLSEKTMKVWNSNTKKWCEKIRVFATQYEENQYPPITHDFFENRSQVGLNKKVDAGYLLFSPSGKAIKDSIGFITTNTELSVQGSRFNKNKIETEKIDGIAIENIGKNKCITWAGPQKKVRIASYLDTRDPVIGITVEGFSKYQRRQFIVEGYIYDPVNFNWGEPQNTYLFVGETGQVVTNPPNKISIQRVGHIVDKHTIYVNIGPKILIDPPETNI